MHFQAQLKLPLLAVNSRIDVKTSTLHHSKYLNGTLRKESNNQRAFGKPPEFTLECTFRCLGWRVVFCIIRALQRRLSRGRSINLH